MNWDVENSNAANDANTPDEGVQGIFRDFKRRKVFRVMGAYAVSAWLILQVVDVIAGAFPVPDWTLAATTIALAIGFPIAAALSWAFQVTPDGIKLDVSTTDGRPVNRSRLIHFIDVAIILVLLVVLGILTFPSDTKPPSEIRIAVLPLENVSGDSADDYLSAGIADDIRTRLYELPQLLIAARSSSNSLGAQALDVQTIGERLGVKHVLEGSIVRDGNRIRVLMQLVDVDTGFASWSKSYNSKFEDVLAMQNNISLMVANQLEILLTPDVRKALAMAPTDSPQAFDFYTQANEFLDRPPNFENLDHASSLYRKAIEFDPAFALGFSGLCNVDVRRFIMSGDTRHVSAAETNCQKALSLNEGLSEVHATLGSLYLETGRLDKSRNEFELALDLDPRSIDAFAGIGRVFMRTGNVIDAEARFRAAIEARPGNWQGYRLLGYFLNAEGRYDEAAAAYERMVELSPDNAMGYNNLGAVYFMRGDFALAAASFERSLNIEPSRGGYSNTGTMYYFAGDYEQAEKLFRQAAEEISTDYRLWGNLADTLRFIDGGREEADALYRKAIEMALGQAAVTGEDASTLSNLAWYHANLGETAQAREYLRMSERADGADGPQIYISALSYALLGEAERARAAILKAKELGFPQVIVEATPEFRSLGEAGTVEK